jgi:hypothetical protein
MRRNKEGYSESIRAASQNEILTCGDAVEMWKRHELGESIRSIARAFRVAPQSVQDVLSGKRFPSAARIAHI